MRLVRSGWLFTLLTDVVSSRAPHLASELSGELLSTLPRRARARAYLKRIVRETGLLFGTPAQPTTASYAKAAEEQLLLAVIRTYAQIALDIAFLLGAPPGARREEVLLLLAVLVGEEKLASEIGVSLAQQPALPLPKKWWSRVESRLEKRATSVRGDPVYGLILHNVAVYADAQTFGRQAIDFFARGHFRPPAAERRLYFAGRQKALLAKVLVGLACVERQPNFAAERAILRQAGGLRLPWRQRSALKRALKRFFHHPPAVDELAQQVRSGELRRFVLEQTILASLVDGSRSPREVAFIRELAARLKVSAEELDRIEVEMAEFFAKNRSIVDLYKVSPGAGAMGEELVQAMQRTLEKNFYRLIREVRETGELSVLLTRAARGQRLTPDERRKMRAQLIDVAKAIPALAIFAAPGGILLLIALAKVLPFNILPSAFQDDTEEDLVPRSTKRVDA
jgi:DnaJ-domain-containing protein 1